MISYSPCEGCIRSTLIVHTLWHQIFSRCYSASLLKPVLNTIFFEYLAAIRYPLFVSPVYSHTYVVYALGLTDAGDGCLDSHSWMSFVSPLTCLLGVQCKDIKAKPSFLKAGGGAGGGRLAVLRKWFWIAMLFRQLLCTGKAVPFLLPGLERTVDEAGEVYFDRRFSSVVLLLGVWSCLPVVSYFLVLISFGWCLYHVHFIHL